jgi:hypothetical protein
LGWIHSKPVEITLAVLLALDVCCVIADLLIELRLCGATEVERVGLEHARLALKWTSLSILFIFAAELLLLLVLLRTRFFKHVLYIIDLVIVPASIILDFVLHDIQVR